MKPVLVHTHFHNRRTGVTRSIENVMPFFKESFDAYVYGDTINWAKTSSLKLVQILFSNKKTIVHCHRNNEIIRMLFFRLLGAKFSLIATRHAESHPSSFTFNLLKKTDYIITLTESMSNSLQIENTIIGHGVNVDFFIPKKQIGYNDIPQKNIILCAGRVRASKGQETLFEAAKVLSKNKSWALLVVGKIEKTSFYNKLKKIIDRNSVQNQIYFIDETIDINRYYQSAKIFVAPSLSEGFSLVAAEAMSCGCTVIATKKVGIHSKLIKHGKSGYLFEAGNAVQLEKLILGLIQKKLPFLGDMARKEIETNWNSKLEAKKLIELYKKSVM